MNSHQHRSWWSALLAIAATYFYFLIFAEFAFLELARNASAASESLQRFMLALGVGGIAGGVSVVALSRRVESRTLLAWALRACAVAAMAALLARGPVAMTVVASVVGLSLGGLTVALASLLRRATGDLRMGLCIGAGTGIAYALCNFPVVFRAEPVAQTLLAALAVGVASLFPQWMNRAELAVVRPSEAEPVAVVRWLAILLALVWMDSAAFYIVQHTPALRAANWDGSSALFTNAAVHLVFAIVAGVWLDRGRRGVVVGIAIVALALACLILNETVKLPAPAGWFYTAGVSFYSVVLVEYPARSGRPWLAALVFGVAGWLGSALGIGMAQDLARIPGSFVVVAFAAVVGALLWRARALRPVVAVAAISLAAVGEGRADSSATLIARGREVYIGEGCIHCHSQFIRPLGPGDVELWGPAKPLRQTLAAAPPLIGTRRQGPDLANVGNRRSAEWNRLHLISPRAVSPGSRMPSYAHLFRPGELRGEALVAYLVSLGAETLPERWAQIVRWVPDERVVAKPDTARRLFARLCLPCHGPAGRGDGPLAASLSLRPQDWTRMPFRHAVGNGNVEVALSRIVKFGLPGLPMAGHEYLPDSEVVALARFVQTLRVDHEVRAPDAKP